MTDSTAETLARVDEVLTFYSAGLGEEVTVPREIGPAQPGTPEWEAMVLRESLPHQSSEWLLRFASNCDERPGRGAWAAMARAIVDDRVARQEAARR